MAEYLAFIAEAAAVIGIVVGLLGLMVLAPLFLGELLTGPGGIFTRDTHDSTEATE
jgi:hypothetical protein